MVTYTWGGDTYEFEDRICPHCNTPLEPWLGPPDSGWGIVLVCNNNKCSHYTGSADDILHRRDDSNLGCRYAENPDNGYKPFNLVAVCW